MFSPGSRFHMGSKRPATNHRRDSVWLEKPMGKFRKKPVEAEAHPAHTVAAVNGGAKTGHVAEQMLAT